MKFTPNKEVQLWINPTKRELLRLHATTDIDLQSVSLRELDARTDSCIQVQGDDESNHTCTGPTRNVLTVYDHSQQIQPTIAVNILNYKAEHEDGCVSHLKETYQAIFAAAASLTNNEPVSIMAPLLGLDERNYPIKFAIRTAIQSVRDWNENHNLRKVSVKFYVQTDVYFAKAISEYMELAFPEVSCCSHTIAVRVPDFSSSDSLLSFRKKVNDMMGMNIFERCASFDQMWNTIG